MLSLRSRVCDIVLAGLVPAIVLVAVGESLGQTPRGSVTKQSTRPSGPAAKPPTAEECQALAAEITKAVANRDAAALDRVVDWDAILERITSGIDLQENLRKQMIAIIKENITNDKGFSAAIMKVIQNDGSYTLLRKRSFENTPSLLYRLINPVSGVIYHDLILGRNAAGQVKAIDLYIHSTGEKLSETLRRSYIQIASTMKPEFAGKFQETDKQTLDYFVKLGKMNEAERKGEFQQVLAISDSVPEKYRHEKIVCMTRIRVAQAMGDEGLYAKAIEDFRKAFPKESVVNLMSIAYFILRKEFDNALACIDLLDQALGGDPYLKVRRASVYLEKGDLQASLKNARSAIAAEPDLIEGYWSLVTVALRQKDHVTVLKTLRQLRDEHDIQFGDLTTVEEYKDFVKSPQYKQWLKSKPADKKSSNSAGPRAR